MKDNYMLFVLLAVMLTPFFPILLKSKCPKCNKRKLEHLETVNKEVKNSKTYITYYHCHNCDADFQRNKSGPLKQIDKRELPSSDSELISA